MTRRVLLAAACLLLLALPPWSVAAQQPFDPFAQSGIDRRDAAAVPMDLPFRDESGAEVTLRGLAAGRPLVLAPVLHDCPNICGVTLTGLGQAIVAQDLVPGRDFTVVAFGIDPAEGIADAAADVERFRRAFPAVSPAGFRAVTGSDRDVAAVTDALGYRYGWDASIGQYAHVAAVAVLTPDGRLSRWLYGLTPDPTDLKLALIEAGQGRVGDWGDQLLLLCYHYDPQTGRYGSLVWTLLRIGGGATVAFGAAWIGLSLLRGRKRGRGRP